MRIHNKAVWNTDHFVHYFAHGICYIEPFYPDQIAAEICFLHKNQAIVQLSIHFASKTYGDDMVVFNHQIHAVKPCWLVGGNVAQP